MDRPRTKDTARGQWKSILPQCGIDARFLTGRHGPCPMCEGTDRWRFDDKDGYGTWFCTHCGAGDGLALVMLLQQLDYRGACQRVEQALGTCDRSPASPVKDTAAADRAAMNDVWGQGRRLDLSSVAGRYLHDRTGVSEFAPDLRAVASLKHFAQGERVPTLHPALVALVRDPAGKPVNVHRTYLSAAGGKANVDPVRKAMRGGHVGRGAAIRLAKPNGALGIAEGIETALSATALHGVPCWASVTALGLEQWQPPPDVDVVIFGDNDASFTGHKATYALAFRLTSEGRSVRVVLPEQTGDDWNDVYARQLGSGAV